MSPTSRIAPGNRRTSRWGACTSLMLPLALTAVLLPRATAAPSSADRDKPAKLHPLQYKLDVLARNFALVACTPELEEMMADLRRECEASLRAMLKGQVLAPARMTCPSKTIQRILQWLELRHKASFAHTIQGVRHAIVPFSRKPTGAASPPAGDLQWLSRERFDRLSQLLKVPLIDSTKLLLVTSESEGPLTPEQRLDWVRSFLRVHAQLPNDHHIDWALTYNLLDSEDKLRYPKDFPQPTERQDLPLWVWIFRIDC